MDEDGEPVKLEDVEKEGDGGVGDEGLVELREVESVEKEEAKSPRTSRPKRGKREAVKVEGGGEEEVVA